MQYLLFLLSHPVITLFFRRNVILQQTFIQIGRSRNFVDKAGPFDQFSVNSMIVGATLLIG